MQVCNNSEFMLYLFVQLNKTRKKTTTGVKELNSDIPTYSFTLC